MIHLSQQANDRTFAWRWIMDLIPLTGMRRTWCWVLDNEESTGSPQSVSDYEEAYGLTIRPWAPFLLLRGAQALSGQLLPPPVTSLVTPHVWLGDWWHGDWVLGQEQFHGFGAMERICSCHPVTEAHQWNNMSSTINRVNENSFLHGSRTEFHWHEHTIDNPGSNILYSLGL